MKLPLALLALSLVAGCAHGFGEGAASAGDSADAERAPSVEAPAPRRHQGNLGRGGIYDN
jgi:hypothetical protein